MMRRTKALTYISIIAVLSAISPVRAQHAAYSAGRKLDGPLANTGGAVSSAERERLRVSLENDRKQMEALLKRRGALQRYLASVGSDSADYKAAEGAIRELDVKLHDLKERAKAAPASAAPAGTAAGETSSPFGGELLAARPKDFARAAAPPMPQAATEPWQGLTNNLIQIIQAKIDQTSNTKQTEAPSVSENSTALVDQSSASDLIGVALNLSGLSAQSNGDDKEADNVSVTASAYSIYSALQGADPLNPVFYNENRAWRRAFFTLGYDDEKLDGAETTERAKIYGVKVMLVDKRDPGLYSADFDRVRQSATAAGSIFVAIRNRAIAFLYADARSRMVVLREFKGFLERRRADTTISAEDRARLDRLLNQVDASPGNLFVLGPDGRFTASSTLEEREFFADFNNRYISPGPAGTPVASLDAAVLKDLQKLLEQEANSQLGTFTALDAELVDLIKKIRKAPQLSFYFLTKQREKGVIDDYTGELIYDYGLGDRVNLTLNGAFEYKNSRQIGGDTRGGKFAGQLQFRFNKQPESLVGKKPVYFYLATDNKFGTGKKPIFKGQAKLMIPVADGFEIPLSVTFANKTELNEEKVVRGQFGFTFDTARLLRAFLPE